MLRIFMVLLICSALAACGSETANDASATDSTTTTTTTAPVPSNTQATTITNTDGSTTLQTQPAPTKSQEVNVPAGPDGIVHHFICADKCDGGTGDKTGPCPKCGKTMSHNKAFHTSK